SVEGAIAVEEIRIVSSFFMRAVIAGEKDQRTAVKTGFDKLFHQAADVAVHAGDHRREVLLEPRPIAVSIGAVVGDFHSIAGEVAKLIVGVRRRVGQHEEERRPVRLLHEIQTSLREQIRRVLFALIEPIAREEILVLILPEMLRIVIVSMLLIEIAEEGIESAGVRNTSCGRAAKSPFPEDRRLVTGALQKIRYCDFSWANTGLGFLVAANRGVAGMQSGHQGAARGRAHGTAGIGLCESHSLSGDPIEIRCGDLFLSVAAEIAVSKIVGKDEKNIGSRRNRRSLETAEAQHTCGKRYEFSPVHR